MARCFGTGSKGIQPYFRQGRAVGTGGEAARRTVAALVNDAPTVAIATKQKGSTYYPQL